MASVVLVGRPNVGKSTLFNRLIGLQRSIVEPTPGVTRDRVEGECSWLGRSFTLVDTGGVTGSRNVSIDQEVLKQVEAAIHQSDIILFVVDARDGVLHLDEEVVQKLARLKLTKPILLVANKVDFSGKEFEAHEFFGLGLGEPVLISALHGMGIGDLLDRIVATLENPYAAKITPLLQFSIVGRPNVGKSSITNALLGESRVIVHDEPGTTRDSVDTAIRFEDKTLILIDTAGLRKRSKATEPIEFYSRTRTMEALQRSQIAVLVLEASKGVMAQDKRIAGEIEEAGKGIVILANKWDLLDPTSKKSYRDFVKHVREELYFINYAPVIRTSALTGEGVDKILPSVIKVYEASQQSFKIADLKKVLDEATFVSPPPSVRGQKVRFKSVAPIGNAPLTFLLKTSTTGKIPDFYLHFLENKFRESFDLEGNPLRLKLQAVDKKSWK